MRAYSNSYTFLLLRWVFNTCLTVLMNLVVSYFFIVWGSIFITTWLYLISDYVEYMEYGFTKLYTVLSHFKLLSVSMLLSYGVWSSILVLQLDIRYSWKVTILGQLCIISRYLKAIHGVKGFRVVHIGFENVSVLSVCLITDHRINIISCSLQLIAPFAHSFCWGTMMFFRLQCR